MNDTTKPQTSNHAVLPSGEGYPLILVAENNASQLKLTEMLLRDVRARVVALDNANDVLEFLKEKTPSLVILNIDFTMPGERNGLDLCGRIKRIKRLSHVPVVLLTEHKNEAVEEASRWEKADLLLEKPLSITDFGDMVSRLLKKSEHAAVKPKVDPALKSTAELFIEDGTPVPVEAHAAHKGGAGAASRQVAATEAHKESVGFFGSLMNTLFSRQGGSRQTA